jgi:hypothetical protein
MDWLIPSDPDPTMAAVVGGAFVSMSSLGAVEPDNDSVPFHIPQSWTENGPSCDSAETYEPSLSATGQSSSFARRARRCKAPKLPAERWELAKARIVSLHIIRKIPLTQVKARIEREFGFTATYVHQRLSPCPHWLGQID